MVAESRALCQGLQLCLDKGFHQIDIEVDSMVLLMIIQRRVRIPWAIEYIIRQCLQALQRMEYSIIHTFRENNQAADFMANLGCALDKHVILYRNDIFLGN